MASTIRAPRNIQLGGKWHKQSSVVVWPSGQTNASVSQGVYLSFRSGSRRWYVHVVVAQAFIPNPQKKPFVNHKDGNKHNNKVGNLEWVTCLENNLHAIFTGLRVYKPRVIFTKRQINYLRKSEVPRYKLALKYGVSEKVIYNIQYFKTYKNI